MIETDRRLGEGRGMEMARQRYMMLNCFTDSMEFIENNGGTQKKRKRRRLSPVTRVPSQPRGKATEGEREREDRDGGGGAAGVLVC